VRQKQTAFNKALGFIAASIEKVNGIAKPQKKFLQWLFQKWLMLAVRHNFLNIFRYADGQYCERSLRHQFSLKINFFSWFESAFNNMKGKECIAVFDPSYIKKSGKKTYGKGRFWSGKDQQIKDGLEISCLALIDVSDSTAYSMEAVQRPSSRCRENLWSIMCEHHKQKDKADIALYILSGSRRFFYEKKFYRTTYKSGHKPYYQNAARCQPVLPVHRKTENRQGKKENI